MKVEFGYGKGVQIVDIPDKNLDQILLANDIEHERRGPEAVVYALENPIGSPRLKELVKPGQKICIITSDISRPLPSYDVIPSVLNELNKGGVEDKDITVVFALGSHRNHTEEEKKHLAGPEVYGRVRCEDSNETGFVHMGDTSAGTPVDICRRVAEADFKICLGNVEFHYFAGYSGGGKKMIAEYEAPDRPKLLGAPRQYGISQQHKHLKEMAYVCGLDNAPVFCPIVADFYSGMEVSVALTSDMTSFSLDEIKDIYKKFYKDGPLIHFKEDADESGFLSAAALSGRDDMEISLSGNEERMILTARFDNLGKGASGSAIQNMNIVMGLDETTGLITEV